MRQSSTSQKPSGGRPSGPSSTAPRSTRAAPVPEETLRAHATRALRAQAAAGLDALIGGLQKLREKAGPQPKSGTADWLDEVGLGADRPRVTAAQARQATGLPVTEVAPRPKRRLRNLLVYAVLAALLAGAGVIGYLSLVQDLLSPQLSEIRQLKIALAQSRAAEVKSNEALAAERARRLEPLPAAASPLPNPNGRGPVIGLGDVSPAQIKMAAPAVAARTTSPVPANKRHNAKAMDCTLDPHNIQALKGCIDAFNGG